MSNKITLPSGATVTLKDPSTLKVKDRKRIFKTTEVEGGDLSKAMALNDNLIAILIEEWSFDLPIPTVNVESLDELGMADYDALIEASKSAQKVLFPSLSETVENEQDPKVITANSNA